MTAPLNQALVASRQTLSGKGVLSYLAPVGSRAYGTDRADSDYDFKGIYTAPLRDVLSLNAQLKNIGRSEPFDLTLYELGSFCKLAAAANPTVLELLWADGWWHDGHMGMVLRMNRKLFLSKRVAQTYGGYAMGQVEKAKRGEGSARGVDHFKREKFRLHTLRLLMAGRHALETGNVLVRLTPQQVDDLRVYSYLPFHDFELIARLWMRRMDEAVASSSLPDEPDYAAINKLLYELRLGAR